MSKSSFLGVLQWRSLAFLLALIVVGRLAHGALALAGPLPLIDWGTPTKVLAALALVLGALKGIRLIDPDARLVGGVRRAIREEVRAAGVGAQPVKPPPVVDDAKPPVVQRQRFCPTCGRPVAPGKKFCAFDGTRLPER